MKTINFKGKGEHSVNELELIIEQQAEELHLIKSKSDSEQLHTEVFNLANKLAINGYWREAVKMHGICNGM
jgi:shikimate kinase